MTKVRKKRKKRKRRGVELYVGGRIDCRQAMALVLTLGSLLVASATGVKMPVAGGHEGGGSVCAARALWSLSPQQP